MKNSDLNIALLNEKINLLKNELDENKLYLELCFVALLIIIFGYFRTELGQATFFGNDVLGFIMVLVAIGLYTGIVYFFYSVIKISSKNEELIQEKINNLTKK